MVRMVRLFLRSLDLPTELTGEKPHIQKDIGEEYLWLHKLFPDGVANDFSVPKLTSFVKTRYANLDDGDEWLWDAQFNRSTWLCDHEEGRQFIEMSSGFMGFGPACLPPANDENTIYQTQDDNWLVKQGDVAVWWAMIRLGFLENMELRSTRLLDRHMFTVSPKEFALIRKSCPSWSL
jgi:hypothetical protein